MKLMIGVSTEQNTVNLIPAIQLKADKFILIETSLAAKNNWSKGLIKVLTDRNIIVEIIKLSETEDNRIDLIFDILYKKFNHSEEQLIWNLGGGQKTHQIAIWQTFNQIKSAKDSVCYSNPIAKKIEIWQLNDEKLVYSEETIKVHISAEEIFNVYGQKVENTGIQFYQKNQRLNLSPSNDLFKYPEFRQYFFSLGGISRIEKDSQTYSLAELKEVFEGLKKNNMLKEEIKEKARNINNNIENYSLSLKNNILDFVKMSLEKPAQPKEIKLVNNDFIKLLRNLEYYDNSIKINFDLINKLVSRTPKSPANYFEDVIVKRTKKLLERTDEHNYIFEAYANFKSSSGEYDILLVTIWGTLIALDAKTFDVDKKDSDARLYNLTLSGGRYVNWIPVIPYDPECTIYMSGKLKKLPKTLFDMKKKFFVVSDNYSSDYLHNIDTFDIPMLLFDNLLTHLELV